MHVDCLLFKNIAKVLLTADILQDQGRIAVTLHVLLRLRTVSIKGAARMKVVYKEGVMARVEIKGGDSASLPVNP